MIEGLSEIVIRQLRNLVTRFINRTEYVKDKIIQPPTPPTSPKSGDLLQIFLIMALFNNIHNIIISYIYIYIYIYIYYIIYIYIYFKIGYHMYTCLCYINIYLYIYIMYICLYILCSSKNNV